MKKSILKHNVVKLLKTKSKCKFLKAVKEKWHIIYRKSRILINADFAFKLWRPGDCTKRKKKSCQYRILYSAKNVLQKGKMKRICYSQMSSTRFATGSSGWKSWLKENNTTRKLNLQKESITYDLFLFF